MICRGCCCRYCCVCYDMLLLLLLLLKLMVLPPLPPTSPPDRIQSGQSAKSGVSCELRAWVLSRADLWITQQQSPCFRRRNDRNTFGNASTTRAPLAYRANPGKIDARLKHSA
jgi:hypothetical protein